MQSPTTLEKVVRPTVALVGRPNVGKSALFNRMVGARRAIVEDIPGTTRDRLSHEVEWRGSTFDLIDTGGVAEPTSVAGSGAYIEEIRGQVMRAVAEASLVLFLVDSTSGTTAADREVADMLRRSASKVVVVANKADNMRRTELASEFFEFGLGKPQAVSALNGGGVGELLDLILDSLPPAMEAARSEDAGLRVALMGRPNVGKSSLANAILGEDRAIVSEIPGTTRDAIDSPFEYHGERMTLIDTAGIRRPGKLEGSIEHYSVVRSRQAVERADVAVLVFDASERFRAQDLHVMGLALERSVGLVACGNKWDLVREDVDRSHYLAGLRSRLRFATWVPLVLTSAVAATGIDELLVEVQKAGEEGRQRIPTGELNAILRGTFARRPPPTVGHRRLKLLYATQVGVSPPAIVLFCNDAALVNSAYRHYLENSLRSRYGFRGTGLRLMFRSRGEDQVEV